MTKIILAPMCGITDYIYRSLCFEFGCDIAFTEMISAMGYLCAPKQRATQDLLIRHEKESNLIVQLFGKDPDIVSEAARKICEMKRFDGIDINMGCPAKKIAPSGEGCGLMRNPAVAKEMMKKTVLASDVPVSVKLRLGYDNQHINVLDYAKMAEDCGVAFITVHGRTREQQYSGQADWNIISKVKSSVKIPVIGNGDIYTPETALKKQAESRVDGIMIGRGAMGNPWIFRNIRRKMEGLEPLPVSDHEKCSVLIRHYHMMLDAKPHHIAVREMRKHIGWYIRGMNGAGKFRYEINACQRADEAIHMITDFFSESE